MKSIIKELYYGYINPIEAPIERDSDYHRALKNVIEKEENLMKRLDETQQMMFEDYIKAHSEIMMLTALEKFTYGFKLGSAFSIEVLAELDE